MITFLRSLAAFYAEGMCPNSFVAIPDGASNLLFKTILKEQDFREKTPFPRGRRSLWLNRTFYHFIEFFGEDHRFYDLKRWYSVSEIQSIDFKGQRRLGSAVRKLSRRKSLPLLSILKQTSGDWTICLHCRHEEMNLQTSLWNNVRQINLIKVIWKNMYSLLLLFI